jgi:hypothetical protein
LVFFLWNESFCPAHKSFGGLDLPWYDHRRVAGDNPALPINNLLGSASDSYAPGLVHPVALGQTAGTARAIPVSVKVRASANESFRQLEN